MSAIAGIWYPDGRPAGEALARMLAALRPFGPDPAGQRVEDHVGMGRRLIATTPEDRHDRQPLVSRDGMLQLVADIRLDDRSELARALAIEPAEAARTSDAALLLRALERWGEASLDHVYGSYAFAFWDARRQRWLLARDALGGRPLHYSHTPGCFAFASMPRGLHALPELPYEVDERTLAHALELVLVDPGATCFRHVAKVPQGHLVTVDRAGVQVRRHWNPHPAPLRLRGVADYQQAFRTELDRAVGNALRGVGSADEVGAQMSAGLDSTAVAATAARLLAPGGQRVVAFTAVPRAGFDGVGPRGKLLDEGAIAADVAAMHANIEHVLVRTPDRSPLDGLDRAFHLYEQPRLNPCNGVWTDAILDRARARGLRVLLVGNLGNFTLSHRGHGVIHGLVRQGRLARATRELLALRRREAAGPLRLIAELLGPELSWTLRDLLGRHPEREAARRHTLRADRRAEIDPARHRIGLPVAGRGLARRLALLHLTDPANIRKGALAHWGIDERDPTADRRFVEFCLSLPEDQHLRDGIPAALVRTGLADRLPDSVLAARQRGLQASDWHMGLSAQALAAQIESIARSRGAAGLVDIARLQDWTRAWDTVDWSDDAMHRRYRQELLRAISFGHFLARAERANG